ncbi:MAG: AbrB/MazE/SpoVT family DNA-binding domain-containing protein [Clostridia bacterium]|nr:AbrB/MazE/SpoVT family DNA-binding domain-containing protein [Clostridia bacterium]
MKATGIIRRVDELGRVVIPIEIRNQFNIVEKDPIEIYVDGSSIVLKKYEPNCVFCGSTENLVEYKDKLVCDKCSKELNVLQEQLKK